MWTDLENCPTMDSTFTAGYPGIDPAGVIDNLPLDAIIRVPRYRNMTVAQNSGLTT